jgi:hypothetical protein
MFNWKVGDQYIHYSLRGEMSMGQVTQVILLREYEPRLSCKFVNVVLVNDTNQQIPVDGSKGSVYKIEGCDELG